MTDKSSQFNNDTPLRDIEHFSNQLLESLPSAVYTCDTEGYLKLFNKSALKLWGIEPEIGTTKWCGSWKIYKPDGTLSTLEECPMAITIMHGRVVSGEEIIIERPDGVRINVLSHPVFMRDAAENVVGTINILEDITALRNAEEKLIKNSVAHEENVKFFKNELEK